MKNQNTKTVCTLVGIVVGSALLLFIMVWTMVGLTSCSRAVSEEVNNQEFGTQEVVDNNKFEIINHYSYNFTSDSIYYVYDKETLVEYIVVISTSGYGNGCSITPRYNADGTLKIYGESNE